MLNNATLNSTVTANFKGIKLWLLAPAFLLLFLIFIYFVLYNNGASYTDAYINLQKDTFLSLNKTLSQFPSLQNNLTQLGDVIIFFPFVAVFIVYAPKLWEALLASALLSLVVSASLKKLFAVPRPAAAFDQDSFTIIGKTLTGHTSLPSGHSIATFIVITIILFAFMPKTTKSKAIWSIFILALGLIIAFSRVGVGAHYPLDVIIGSTLGFIVTIIGIQTTNTSAVFTWLKNKKLYPIFMLALTAWAAFLVKKIVDVNLIIFYISLSFLVVTIYLMTNSYVKKNK